MTYSEVFEYIDEGYEMEDWEDLGEMYEQVSEDWIGRNDFSDIITVDEFFNHYEG